MEKRVEEIAEEENKVKNKKSKGFTIAGISIWIIFAYFIIYSVLGYVIETLFGLLTKGVIESRKSFIIGPFCAIYGLGAVSMILPLQHFKKNNYTLFFGGYIIGSIVEYIISVFGEVVLHVKWWDYSGEPLNINGRICALYSLFWGILAIYLISYVNVKVDKLIDKLKEVFKNKTKLLRGIVSAMIVFLFIDCIYTAIALQLFYVRLQKNYNLELQGIEKYAQTYTTLYENNKYVRNYVDKYLNDEVMLRTFPNLRVLDKDGNMIYIDSVIKTISPYYIKVFEPREKLEALEERYNN